MNKISKTKWSCTHGSYGSDGRDSAKAAFDAICPFSWNLIAERFEIESARGDRDLVIFIKDLKISAARESYVYFVRREVSE
jgi:hypothetical protein